MSLIGYLAHNILFILSFLLWHFLDRVLKSVDKLRFVSFITINKVLMA